MIVAPLPRPVPVPRRLPLVAALWWLRLRAWWRWRRGCHPVAGLIAAGRWQALDQLADEVQP